MQRILLSRHKDWVDFEVKYLKLLKPIIEKKLGSPRIPIRKAIVGYLRKNLDEILLGEPLKLEQFVSRLNHKRASGISFNRYIKENAQFRRQLNEAFPYKWFRKKHGAWLGGAIGIKACPYCNSQFVLSLEKDDKALFHFDHFFPKKRFPYLSLSLYNLIPSCFYCNQRKSDTHFGTHSLCHPYLEDFQQLIKFKTKPGSAIRFLTQSKLDLDTLQLETKLEKKAGIAFPDEKFQNHRKVFLLGGVYDNHKDVVAEIYIKARIYNKTMRTQLASLGKKSGILFLTDADIDRLVLGNYSTEVDINKRPLSKFTIDIAREAKLIK